MKLPWLTGVLDAIQNRLPPPPPLGLPALAGGVPVPPNPKSFDGIAPRSLRDGRLLMQLGLGLGLELRHSLELNPQQKLVLQALLRPEFPDDQIPDATKGLAGLRAADAKLKERGLVGVMFGGLSREVWSQRRTDAQLCARKDVDVIVLSSNDATGNLGLERFEDGIDWWVPRMQDLEVLLSDHTAEKSRFPGYRWFENGNGCILYVKVAQSGSALAPGLHIMDRDAAIKAHIVMLHAASQKFKLDVDTDVLDKLEERLNKTTPTRLMRGVRGEFPLLESWQFEFKVMELPFRVAIANAQQEHPLAWATK